jgi:hypothetical protein
MTARSFREIFAMTLFSHIPKAAMIAAGVALGTLAYAAPGAQAFGGLGGGGHGGGGGFHGGGLGGFHGGGFRGGRFGGYGGYGWGGWGGWGYPYGVGWGYWPYYDDYGYYDDDVATCVLRRVHVHTVHGWRWRTYEYC